MPPRRRKPAKGAEITAAEQEGSRIEIADDSEDNDSLSSEDEDEAHGECADETEEDGVHWTLPEANRMRSFGGGRPQPANLREALLPTRQTAESYARPGRSVKEGEMERQKPRRMASAKS